MSGAVSYTRAKTNSSDEQHPATGAEHVRHAGAGHRDAACHRPPPDRRGLVLMRLVAVGRVRALLGVGNVAVAIDR
jgi:hypothetical protein